MPPRSITDGTSLYYYNNINKSWNGVMSIQPIRSSDHTEYKLPDPYREVHKALEVWRKNLEESKVPTFILDKESSVEIMKNINNNKNKSIMPEIEGMIGFEQRNPYHQHNVFNHTIQAIKNCTSTDLIARLAVLFHDIGKPHCYQDDEDGIRHFKGHGRVSADMTDEIMKRLKFDNDTRNSVVQLVYYHDATFEVGKKYIKRWLNKIGVDQFRRLLDVRRADIKGQKIDYDKDRIEKVDNIERLLDEVLEENQCFTLKDLAVNGKDLMQIGFKTGKELGETLNILLEGVINEEFENDKDYLLNVAKERL